MPAIEFTCQHIGGLPPRRILGDIAPKVNQGDFAPIEVDPMKNGSWFRLKLDAVSDIPKSCAI